MGGTEGRLNDPTGFRWTFGEIVSVSALSTAGLDPSRPSIIWNESNHRIISNSPYLGEELQEFAGINIIENH